MNHNNGGDACHGITPQPSKEGACRNTPQGNDGLAGVVPASCAKPCLVTPENECKPDADGKCYCAPPGHSHDDRCAIRRGHKCNCMVAVVVSDGYSLAMPLRFWRR